MLGRHVPRARQQVVYLQSDPGTYVIGNITYNLAGVEGGDGSSLAPLPIPGLPHFARLNEAFATFVKDMSETNELRDTRRAFFVSPDKRSVDFEPAITSFLCTDAALEIFRDGGAMLDRLSLAFPDEKHPGSPTAGRTGSASTRRAGSSSTPTSRDFGGRPTSCRVV